jgi:hypothetical protein
MGPGAKGFVQGFRGSGPRVHGSEGPEVYLLMQQREDTKLRSREIEMPGGWMLAPLNCLDEICRTVQ